MNLYSTPSAACGVIKNGLFLADLNHFPQHHSLVSSRRELGHNKEHPKQSRTGWIRMLIGFPSLHSIRIGKSRKLAWELRCLGINRLRKDYMVRKNFQYRSPLVRKGNGMVLVSASWWSQLKPWTRTGECWRASRSSCSAPEIGISLGSWPQVVTRSRVQPSKPLGSLRSREPKRSVIFYERASWS